MPIKCGKGHYHDSIQEVRECYGTPEDLTKRTYRVNRYPGTCRKCGGQVEAEKGRIDKTEFGWQASHLEGQCRVMPAKVPVEGNPNYADRYTAIPTGHYATKSLTGNNDLDFWR